MDSGGFARPVPPPLLRSCPEAPGRKPTQNSSSLVRRGPRRPLGLKLSQDPKDHPGTHFSATGCVDDYKKSALPSSHCQAAPKR